MRTRAWLLGGLLVTLVASGCATGASPVGQIERAQESVYAARDLGAAFAPGAADYLRTAGDELTDAQRLAAHGQNDHARTMAMRAQADADLAARLAHEASLLGTSTNTNTNSNNAVNAGTGGGPRDLERPEPIGTNATRGER